MYTLTPHTMGELLSKELVYYISHYGNAMTDRFDIYHIDGDASHYRLVVSVNPSNTLFSAGFQPVTNEFTIPNKNNDELKGIIEDIQAWIVMVSWARTQGRKKKAAS